MFILEVSSFTLVIVPIDLVLKYDSWNISQIWGKPAVWAVGAHDQVAQGQNQKVVQLFTGSFNEI